MATTNHNLGKEQQAAQIQAMPLSEWRAVAANHVLLFEQKGEVANDWEEEETTHWEQLQQMPLEELRALKGNAIALSPTLEEKIHLTGLTATVIQQLETQKEKATLEQILTYCQRLHIPIQQFVPELFGY